MGSKPFSAASATSNRSISENASVDSCVEIFNEDAEYLWEYGISIDGENAIKCKIYDEIQPFSFVTKIMTLIYSN